MIPKMPGAPAPEAQMAGRVKPPLPRKKKKVKSAPAPFGIDERAIQRVKATL